MLEDVFHQVVRHRARRRHDQAADRAQHRRERDGGNDRERQFAKALGQQRGGHVAVGRIEVPAHHRAQADVEREDVKEPDAGDADDGALPRRRGVFDGVVADQNMRQRRRAGEEGEHEGDEVEFVEQLR